jgi:hypothetical protein
VLASFKQLEDGDVEIWITSDVLTGIEEVVTARLRTFAGDSVWEERLQVQVAPGGSRPVRRWGNRELGGTPDRYLSVRSAKGTFRPNRHFFAAIKDFDLEPGESRTVIVTNQRRILAPDMVRVNWR